MNEQISILYQNSEEGFILSIVKDDEVVAFTEPTDDALRIISDIKNTLQ